MASRVWKSAAAFAVASAMVLGFAPAAQADEDGGVDEFGLVSDLHLLGEPMHVEFVDGQAPALSDISGLPTGTNVVGATKITLKNSSRKDAVVSSVKVEGLSLPSELTGNDYVGLYLDSNDVPNLMRQVVAGAPPLSDQFKEITVPARKSVQVWAYLWGKKGTDSFVKLGTADQSFDLAFKYRLAGSDGPSHTEKFTGNRIAVTSPVIATGSPMNLEFKAGQSPALDSIPGLSSGTNTAGATKITLTNTGATDAEVSSVKVEGIGLPNDLSGNDYVGLYLDSNEVPNLRRQIIAGAPGLADQFKTIMVPAGKSVDVWAYLWGKKGADSFTKLQTHDVKFDLTFSYRVVGASGTAATTIVGNRITAAAPTPIVFVHGYRSNSGTFGTVKRYFEDRNYGPLYFFDYRDTTEKAVSVNADLLWNYLTENGLAGKRVTLVGHSLGGLVARKMVADHAGEFDLDQLVLLAAPNNGAKYSSLCVVQVTSWCSDAVMDMKPSSVFLKTLNQQTVPHYSPDRVMTYQITGDEMVSDPLLPNTYQRVVGENAAVYGTSEVHSSILDKRQVLEEVFRFVGGTP